MAYSIDGLHGYTNFEYPHTHYFDGELSEILRMYKVLTEDYNILVREIVEAHRLYIEAQSFVERQEQIFLLNQAKIVRMFEDVMTEANRLQQELVEYFNTSSTNMLEKQAELENLFRQLNETQLNEMQEFYTNVIRDIGNKFNDFNQHLDNEIEEFNNSFNQSVDEIIKTIEENHETFEHWIELEFDTLLNVMDSISTSLDDYFQKTKEENRQLELQYIKYLELFREQIILENNIWLDKHEHDTENKRKDMIAYVDGLINDVYEDMEKLKIRNNHELVEHIHVVSPVTLKIRQLQTALYEMYYYYRAWALTAEEYDSLGLTAYEYDNWVSNVGLYPQGKGIRALDYDALGKWILLEKPDILEQVKGDIEKITYDKLNENADKIRKEISDRIEAEYGQRVVTLEGNVRVLENAINVAKEYTAGVEEELKKFARDTVNALIKVNAQLKKQDSDIGTIRASVSTNMHMINNIITSVSVSNHRIDMLEATTTSINRTLSTVETSVSVNRNKIAMLETTSTSISNNVQELVNGILNMQEVVLKALERS